jgi:hypothetical protein
VDDNAARRRGVRLPAVDDPVREFLNVVILAGGLHSGGAFGAMHCAYG